jgi:hypothetical protein
LEVGFASGGSQRGWKIGTADHYDFYDFNGSWLIIKNHDNLWSNLFRHNKPAKKSYLAVFSIISNHPRHYLIIA